MLVIAKLHLNFVYKIHFGQTYFYMKTQYTFELKIIMNSCPLSHHESMNCDSTAGNQEMCQRDHGPLEGTQVKNGV